MSYIASNIETEFGSKVVSHPYLYEYPLYVFKWMHFWKVQYKYSSAESKKFGISAIMGEI